MMIVGQIQYTVPDTVDDAITELAQDENSLVIAGGNGLLTQLKRGELTTPKLVDIGRIAELRGVRVVDEGRLRVGALTTLTDLCIEPVVRTAHMPGVLTDAVDNMGDVQCRNRATVGGTVASAHPGSDLSAALLALDATVCLVNQHGRRVVPAQELIAGGGPDRGELIVWVEIGPASPGSAYAKFVDRANLHALCGVAVAVTLSADNTIAKASIAITGALEVPARLTELERSLVGQTLPATIEIPADLPYASSAAAGAEYRAHLATVLAQRAFDSAVQRAQNA
ncbi:MAG TPA: FAD binding domain-containing protein [Pseudonocardiaceae bacterium]|jgi:carbon-monoxide dehydrogenase medium subunit